MGDGNSKEDRQESSPNGSSQASGSAEATSRPPSTTASVESAKKSEPDKPVIRKSARKRVPKRRSSPSPSPPPQRKKKPSKPPSKKLGTVSAAFEPPKDVAQPKPIKPVATSRARTPEPKAGEEYESDSSTIMSEDPLWFNDPAGVYGHPIRMRKKRHSECIPVVPLPPRTVGGVRDQLRKTKTCNCRRSSCLKLYCDCFMAGLYCTAECHCNACKNDALHPRDRNMAIDVILMRNPNAFRPKVQLESKPVPGRPPSPARAEKGCNCKKSSCLKKYCECFLGSVYCSPLCRCVECKNKVGDKEREELMKERRSKDNMEAAAAALAQQNIVAGRTATTGDKQKDPENKDETVAATVAAAAAADAVEAGAVAEAVNLFLPPSSYAMPMTLDDGRPYPAVAFGRAGWKDGPKQAKPSRPRKSASKTSYRDEKNRYETDLQKLWRVETERVDQTFEKANVDVKKKASPKYRVKETVASKTDPMIDYRARMTLDHVMEDMKDIVSAVNKAEKNAVKRVDEDSHSEKKMPDEGVDRSPDHSTSNGNASQKENEHKKEDSGNELAGPMDVDAIEAVNDSDLLCEEDIGSLGSGGLEAVSLLCEEEIDSSDRKLTGGAVRELTILASQEAALIGQLASVIRRKTLEMTKQRLRLVEEARTKT